MLKCEYSEQGLLVHVKTMTNRETATEFFTRCYAEQKNAPFLTLTFIELKD